jgi:hypothetical protein
VAVTSTSEAMSEMIERVAHRLYDALRPETAPPYWLCERAARAAIEAMREPTVAQINYFVSRALCVNVHGDGGWSEYAKAQWQAMIDAALK